MKISICKQEGCFTSTIWDSSNCPKGVDAFDNNELFFDIPSTICIKPTSLESRVYQTYLLSKLRFLILHDYTLFVKASGITRIADPLSMNIEKGLDQIVSILKNDLRRQHNNGIESILAGYRLRLFENAIYRKVNVSSKWAAKNRMVFGPSFLNFFAECQSQYNKYSPIIKYAIETDSLDCIDGLELLLACHLKPFADSYRLPSIIRPSIKDDRFLKLIAISLYLTKGKFRSNLYILLYCLGAVPLFVPQTNLNSPSNLLAMVTTNNIEKSNGNYTISSGDIKICFDTSSAATILGKRNQISEEMVGKVRETIKKEYEKFKKNFFELNRIVEMECRAYNKGVLPSLKEHWLTYQNSLRQEWFDEIRKGDGQTRLKPLLCFYYIVLQNENSESFFEESFIKDFIIMCINNPGIAINPELFYAMYRFELIRTRASNTESAFAAATQRVATKRLSESKQIQFDVAKQEIDCMIQNLVDSHLINISIFNPRDNFVPLIDAIILDALFQDRIIKDNYKTKDNLVFHFNLKLLLNIIGVLRKDLDFFERGTSAKEIVETMDSKLDAGNLQKYITKFCSNEKKDKRYALLEPILIQRVKNFANDFMGNMPKV